MIISPIIFFLFPIAITLHNLEESIRFPDWSNAVVKFSGSVDNVPFRFAVTVVTLMAYLSTGLFYFFPEVSLFKFIFSGFLGSMIFNTFFPHMVMTIIHRKYCPGLLTGMLFIIPANLIVLNFFLQCRVFSIWQIIISTIVVGVILLLLIPLLFSLGKGMMRRKNRW